MGRRMLIAAMAGLVCGILVLGLGGRVMMRVVALAKGLLYGTLFFVVVVPLQPAPIQAEITELRSIWNIVIPLFWALFLAFGVGVARWSRRPASSAALAA